MDISELIKKIKEFFSPGDDGSKKKNFVDENFNYGFDKPEPSYARETGGYQSLTSDSFVDRFPFRKIRILYPILFVLNIILGVYVVYNLFFSSYTWKGDDEKRIKIERGVSFGEVANMLEEQGVIGNAFILKLAAKLTGKEDEIIARKYLVKNGMTNSELLDLLTNPDLIQTIRFRVLEGYTIRRISKLAEEKLSHSPENFRKAVENARLIKELGLEGKIKNLEGFLFPDTYVIPYDTDEEELVRLMFDEFKKRVLSNTDLMGEIRRNSLDLLEVVTLASITEAETSIDDEMPVISGVYINRIRKRMRLEADPTVQYALPDGPKQRLLYEDLRIDSPYNTYKNFGLPPGPINNPSYKAIESAIRPAKHNYIFFVATGNGGHTFTESYEQHLKAVEDYRNRLKEKKESAK